MKKNIVWGVDEQSRSNSGWPQPWRRLITGAVEIVPAGSGEPSAERGAGDHEEPEPHAASLADGVKQFVLLLAAAGLLSFGLVAVGCSSAGSAATPLAPTGSGAPAFTLVGTVTAVTTEGQQFLPGAQVEALIDDPGPIEERRLRRRMTSTVDGGLFVLTGLSAGEWTVTINTDGYVPAVKHVDVHDDTNVTFELEPIDDGSRLAAARRR